MSSRPRHRQLLCSTLSLSLALSPAAPLVAEERPPGSATVETADGLHVAAFQTPHGRITVNLPDDMAASDTISGTVIAEPDGQTPEQVAQGEDELSGYVVEVADQETPVEQASGRWIIPAAATAATLVLRNRQGQEVARTKVPVQPAAAVMKAAYELPSVGQTGKPLQVKGDFDGDFGTTAVKVAGQAAQVLAESPRKAVVRSPRDVLGPVQIELAEKGASASCTYRNVGIRLSAGKTSLKSGETTALQVAVLGLEGLHERLPVRLVNRSASVVRLQGGDVQSFSTEPAQVQGGRYDIHRTLTGVRPGGFTINAVVEQPKDRAIACLPAAVPGQSPLAQAPGELPQVPGTPLGGGPPDPDPFRDNGVFRVVLNGFQVVNESDDDIIEGDGRRDEVFVRSIAWEVFRGARDMLPTLRSRVMGDITGRPDRVMAGRAEPGALDVGGQGGGLRTGDVFPEVAPFRHGAPRSDRPPMLLWQGALARGRNLVAIMPTVWEWDHPELGRCEQDWEGTAGRWFDRVALMPLRDRILTLQPEQATTPFAQRLMLPCPDGAGTRPIGMGGEATGFPRSLARISLQPQMLMLNYDMADVLARTPGADAGGAPGHVSLTYRDANAHGVYILFLHVERVS